MLMLIDGNNMAHRARHAYNLSNHGTDVSVTYGVLSMINSLLSRYKVDHLAVCWDGGVPEHRRKAIPEYKANRHVNEDPMEYEDLVRQMRELSDYAFPMMGIMSVRREGAEADDLMYHMSKMVAGEVIIVTTDKDLIQAVDDRVSVLNPFHNALYDPAMVEDVYGVPVKLFIDWRALQGDSSDNIPGVTGIGEKTATKLFQEYGSLTAITNAAVGRNPSKNLNGKIATNITSFGFERICKNIFVMALYADRVGARRAIIEAVDNYRPADPVRVKKYFLRNAFASLIGGPFVSRLGRLSSPQIVIGDMKIPVVPTIRRPV